MKVWAATGAVVRAARRGRARREIGVGISVGCIWKLEEGLRGKDRVRGDNEWTARCT